MSPSADPAPDPAAPEPPVFHSEPLLAGAFHVEPDWLDYNGHMNVGYYLLAFDRALDTIYGERLDLGGAYARANGMGPFALETHLTYIREVRGGERFEVTYQLLDCDHKRHHYILMMRTDAALCATCEQISMNVDHKTRRSAPYPERQRMRLEALKRAHSALARPAQVGSVIGIRRGAGSGAAL